MRIITIGGSLTGLAAAAALADQGHEVLVLERDGASPPQDIAVAAGWERPTVPQEAHSHAYGSLGTNLLRDRLPDVYEALVAAGAGEIRLTDSPPPSLVGFAPEPGDEQLRMLTCRRPVFEWVLRERSLSRPGVTSRTGVTVTGLVRSVTDPARICGVRLAGGEELHADLVLDTSGRRSSADRWLGELGLPAPTETRESSRVSYYTRHYKRLTAQPPGPLNRGFGAGGLWNHYTAVLFLADNDTFSISLGVLPDDAAMKELRHEDVFTAAIRATPMLAPWIAPGNSEPISAVHAMGGLDNWSRLATPEQPLPVGFCVLGDAACTTNPSYGRGVSLGLAHVFTLVDLLAGHRAVDAELARQFAGLSLALLGPWLAEANANDRGRAAMWQATVHGGAAPTPPPGVVTFGTAVAAASRDAVIWRQVARVMMMLDQPASLYADADIRERVGRALGAGPPPAMPPGAERGELVDVVTAAAAAATVPARG